MTVTLVQTKNVVVTRDSDDVLHRTRRVPTGEKDKPYLTKFDTITEEELTTLLETT